MTDTQSTFSDWQISMIEKYKLNPQDIQFISSSFFMSKPIPKNTIHYIFKCYVCPQCWQLTALGFIDKCKWLCRDCYIQQEVEQHKEQVTTELKELEPLIMENKELISDEETLWHSRDSVFSSLKEISDTLWKSLRTIHRWKDKWQIIELENWKFKIL